MSRGLIQTVMVVSTPFLVKADQIDADDITVFSRDKLYFKTNELIWIDDKTQFLNFLQKSLINWVSNSNLLKLLGIYFDTFFTITLYLFKSNFQKIYLNQISNFITKGKNLI